MNDIVPFALGYAMSADESACCICDDLVVDNRCVELVVVGPFQVV